VSRSSIAMEHIKETFEKKIAPQLQKRFGYKSPMAIPRLEKVVLNSSYGKMGSGKSLDEQRKIGEAIAEDMALIAGQKPTLTKARKSIATFKLREGAPVGVRVTLRGEKMRDFLERLVRVVLPRSRDFRGLSLSSVDKTGNLNVGIREHLFFPEVSPEKSKVAFSMEVAVTTTAKTREEGLELFKLLGFPFSN